MQQTHSTHRSNQTQATDPDKPLGKKGDLFYTQPRTQNLLVSTRLALEDVWDAVAQIIFFALAPEG